MAPLKVLAVFGATGNQGGSVIKAVQAHPRLSTEFKIRGITRDTSKPNAQALAAQGVEIVQADLNDIESLKTALRGSDAVFGVTNYWEKQSKDLEVQQGKNIADACKAVGVRRLIWSGLRSAVEVSGGELQQVHHFESKAEVTAYIERTKGDMVATYFMPGLFMQNLMKLFRRGPDGVVALTLPWDAETTKVPLFDVVADSGTFVAGILSGPADLVNGKEVQAVSQWATPKAIVDTFNEKTGYDAVFRSIDAATFRSFLPPAVAPEMTENMVLIRDYSYYGKSADTVQAESDKVLHGAEKVSLPSFIDAHSPWQLAA